MSDDIKRCSFCAEEIKIEAIKCKHCGSMLEDKENQSKKQILSKKMTPKFWSLLINNKKNLVFFAISVIVLLAVVFLFTRNIAFPYIWVCKSNTLLKELKYKQDHVGQLKINDSSIDDLKKRIIDNCDKALKFAPEYPEALNNKGKALLESGKAEEALEYFNIALRKKPDNSLFLCNKADALSFLKKYDEAINCYDIVIKIAPNNIEAWYNKGNALANQKKYDEAFKCIDEALKIDKNNFYVWFYKGSITGMYGVERRDKNLIQESVNYLDKSLEINPDFLYTVRIKNILLEILDKI